MNQQQHKLDHISFRDVAWLQNFGLHFGNVLEYVAMSPFYDRTCNNEVLRMQMQFNPHLAAAHQQQQELDPYQRLRQLTGVEYVVAHVQEPILFVIHKQRRHSPDSVSHLESLYIIDGTIYKSPTLKALMKARLTLHACHLNGALKVINDTVRFDPLSGYQWASFDLKTSKDESRTDEFTHRVSKRLDKSMQSYLATQQPADTVAAETPK